MAIDTKNLRSIAGMGMSVGGKFLTEIADALDIQTAELEALWAKVERWQRTAALSADNPSYSPEARALLAARRWLVKFFPEAP